MRLQDRYDGSHDPFEGDRTVVWRSLPANALVTKATVTLTPALPPGQTDYTETLGFAPGSPAYGATIRQLKPQPPSTQHESVEIDFHARRTAISFRGLAVSSASALSVDIGGGVYLAVAKDGTIPAQPGASPWELTGQLLPGITALRLQFTDTHPANAAAGVADVTVDFKSMPSNLTLRFGTLPPFWSGPGELAVPTATPDITDAIHRALAGATVENGYYAVPLIVHSDTLGRIDATLDVEYLGVAPLLPAGVPDVVLAYDYASVPKADTTTLQATLPAGAAPVSPQTAVRIRGAFASSRVTDGPTGETNETTTIDCAAALTIAQPVTPAADVNVSAVDLFAAADGPAARLALDLRADDDGKPGQASMLAKPVAFDLTGDASGQRQWASVPIAPPAQLKGQERYWAVVQALDGSASLGVDATPDPAHRVQVSKDSGFSWRLAGLGSPLLLRLRTVPDRFQMPVDFAVGAGPQQQRVSLSAYDPAGKIDMVIDRPEIATAVGSYVSQAAPPRCAQAELLANSGFSQWSAVGSDLVWKERIQPSRGSGALAIIDTFFDTSSPGPGIGKDVPAQLAFSADGSTVFMLLGQSIDAIDAQTSATPRQLVTGAALFNALAVAPQGGTLYAFPEQLVAIDIATGSQTAITGSLGRPARGNPLVLSPDGGTAYVGLTEGVTAVDLQTGTQRFQILDQPPEALAAGSNAIGVVVLEPAGTASVPVLKVFDALTGRPEWSAPLRADLVQPIAVAFAADETSIFALGTKPASSGTGEMESAGMSLVLTQFDQSGRRVGQRLTFPAPTATMASCAIAVKAQGDRVYVADSPLAISSSGDRLVSVGQAIAVIAVGHREPAGWTLTAGTVAPVRRVGEPAGLDARLHNGALSQVVPVAPACFHDLTVSGKAHHDLAVSGNARNEGGSPDTVVETLWRDANGGLLRTDSLAVPDSNLIVTRQTRAQPPAGSAQAEVRASVTGGTYEFRRVSFASSDELVRDDAWQPDPAGPGSIVVVGNARGTTFRNAGTAQAARVQSLALDPGVTYELDFSGGISPGTSGADPYLELRYLDASGAEVGAAQQIVLTGTEFAQRPAGLAVPPTSVAADLRVVLPAGASLTAERLQVLPQPAETVPFTFIAQSPGELHVSGAQIVYDVSPPTGPSPPPGGLSPPTPPGATPGGGCPDPAAAASQPSQPTARVVLPAPASAGTMPPESRLSIVEEPPSAPDEPAEQPVATSPGSAEPPQRVPAAPAMAPTDLVHEAPEQPADALIAPPGSGEPSSSAARSPARPISIGQAMPDDAGSQTPPEAPLAELNTELETLRNTTAAQTEQISQLRAQLSAEPAESSLLHVARSFQNVLDTLRSEAGRAPGRSAMTGLDLELKFVVQVHKEQATLVFPALDATIDPGVLSSMRASFAPVQDVAPPPAALAAPQAPPRPSPAERQERHLLAFVRKHLDASGQANPQRWRQALANFRDMKVTSVVPAGPAAGTALQWNQAGPAPLRVDPGPDQQFMGTGPLSGQVTDIAIDPSGSTDQTLYVASNDGGIWKSTDGGQSWTPKTDSQPSLSMGAVALDPADSTIIYAGTGNLYNNGFFKAVGLYKSTDAGDTWTTLDPKQIFTTPIPTTFLPPNVQAPRGILHIAVPSANTVLVATTAGLFRSIDGGQSFGKNAPAFDDGNPVLDGFITDLHVDTADVSIIYAAAAGTGVFKSSDGGVTFPTNLFTDPPFTAGGFGNISFGQSTLPDSKTLYASVTVETGLFAQTYFGLFNSTDGGSTWAKVASNITSVMTPAGSQSQIGYDHTLGVDPQDPKRIYLGFQEVQLSTDSGQTFAPTAVTRGKVHWDNHALVFSPKSHWGAAPSPPTALYVGTDGGISTSPDGGGNWTNLNEGIATNLFFGIDIGRGSATNNGHTYGGTQDCGTIEHRPEATFPGTDWRLATNGDGAATAVDHQNPKVVYGTRNGGFIATNDGGNTWSDARKGMQSISLIAVDPNSPGTVQLSVDANGLSFVDPSSSGRIYASAGNQLYQSTNAGANFTSIGTFPAVITALTATPQDSNVIWVGLGNGQAQFTTNATAGTGSITWTTPANQPGAVAGLAIRGIAIDPQNSSDVVAVYAGYTGGIITSSATPPVHLTQRVFFTSDNGATPWKDIGGTDGGDPSQNIPDMPLNAVRIDPSTSPHAIYVASVFGVLRTTDSGATWQVLGTQLPTVDCTSLALDTAPGGTLIRVGTYGRSVYELTIPGGVGGPQVSGVSPGAGPEAGGTSVAVAGSGLAGATGVGFGSVAAASFTADSDVQVTAVSPAGTGTVDVTVTTPAGTSAVVAADQFAYAPAPQVSGVSPGAGPEAGGTSVAVAGSGLAGATGVGFGPVAAASFTADSDVQVTAVSPAGTGTVDVTVTTPAGTSAVVAADQFAYAPAPQVSGSTRAAGQRRARTRSPSPGRSSPGRPSSAPGRAAQRQTSEDTAKAPEREPSSGKPRKGAGERRPRQAPGSGQQ